MTITCPTCNTELPNTSPTASLVILAKWVRENSSWDILESDSLFPVGKSWSIGASLTAQIEAKKTTYFTGDIDKDSYYGDLPQGTTFEVFVIIRVGDNFYKKTGTGDSYGDISWDGDLLPVSPVTRTITEWK